MSEMGRFATVVNIFTSPAEAFPAIKERPSSWFPWLLLMLGVGTVSMLYLNLVDLAWFMEQQIRSSSAGAQLTEAQIQNAIENGAGNIPPVALGAIGAVSSGIFLTLIFFVYAFYLTAISFISHDGIKLRQWFGLICWCLLPLLLGQLATTVNLLANDATLMPQERINPLSFSNLFGLDATGASTFVRVLQNFDLTVVWALILVAFGFQAWTERPLARAALIALAPFLLLGGLGIVLSMR